MLQQPAHTGQASRPSLFTSTVHACKQPAKLNQKGVIMSFATGTAPCRRPCIVLRLCRLRVVSRACHSNLRRTNNNEGTKATRNKQTNERTNERANERSFEPLTDFHVLTHSQSLSVSHCQSVTVSQSLSVGHCQSVSHCQPHCCSDYDDNDIALHCIALHCIVHCICNIARCRPPNHRGNHRTTPPLCTVQALRRLYSWSWFLQVVLPCIVSGAHMVALLRLCGSMVLLRRGAHVHEHCCK